MDRDSQGQPITEREALEAEVRDKSLLLTLSEEVAKSGAWRLTFATGAVVWSSGMFRLFGIEPEAFAADAAAHLSAVYPEDRPMLERVTSEVMNDMVPRPIEFRVVHPNGDLRWVHGEAKQELDADGEVVGLVGFYRDVTEVTEAKDALREQTLGLAEAQRVARLGSWQWDALADKTTWSDELYRLNGRDPGLPAPDYEENRRLCAEESAQRLEAAVQAALEHGTPYELDVEMVRPDGSHWNGVARGEPVVGPDGGVVGVRGTLVDITERRQAEDALRDSEQAYRQLYESLDGRVEQRTLELSTALKELEAALAAKDVLLANVSHEMRTPLNSIIGFSAILESGGAGELPDEARRQVRFIHHSGEWLLATVEGLLDATSIAAGTMRVDVAPVHLDRLLNEVTSSMGPLASEASLKFSVRRPSEPVSLVSDAHAIKVVLSNLIGNAVKFTERGSVALDVTVEGEQVRFAVTDTGPGIANQDISRIRAPFRQLPQPGVAKTRGVGLGLSNSFKIAAALGGKISVKSKLGVGSTFTLIVPMRAPDA